MFATNECVGQVTIYRRLLCLVSACSVVCDAVHPRSYFAGKGGIVGAECKNTGEDNISVWYQLKTIEDH